MIDACCNWTHTQNLEEEGMEKSIVVTEAAPKAIGPYSLGVWAGDFLFVSGQTPTDPATGTIVAGSAATQTHQSIKNVRSILEAAGLSLANVVKSTLFIKDMNEFAAINEVYAGYFSPPYPARSCVEVARLPKDVLVELEVIAAR
jgi:2-iminobutanoate/2-iminopropanoate deaminase